MRRGLVSPFCGNAVQRSTLERSTLRYRYAIYLSVRLSARTFHFARDAKRGIGRAPYSRDAVRQKSTAARKNARDDFGAARAALSRRECDRAAQTGHHAAFG